VKRPAMPLYVKDWLLSKSVRRMGLAGRGAFVELLAHQWMDGPLEVEPDDLRALVGATVREWPAIWRRLEPLFPVVDGGRVNAVLEGHRAERDAYFARQSEKGRKGAEARWHRDGTGIPEAMAENGLAVAVAVAVNNSPPPAGETAVNQLLDQAGRDFGEAKAIGWAAELRMMQQGGRGAEYTCTADQLETACRELLLQTPTGQKLSMKALQGFVRRAVKPLTVAKASALPEEPEGRMAKMIREAIGNDSTRRK